MPNQTLTSIILNYLFQNYPRYISTNEIETLSMRNHHNGSTGSSLCRKLVLKGKIDNFHDNGFVYYRYKPGQQVLNGF